MAGRNYEKMLKRVAQKVLRENPSISDGDLHKETLKRFHKSAKTTSCTIIVHTIGRDKKRYIGSVSITLPLGYSSLQEVIETDAMMSIA